MIFLVHTCGRIVVATARFIAETPDWLMAAIVQQYTFCATLEQASQLSRERRRVPPF